VGGSGSAALAGRGSLDAQSDRAVWLCFRSGAAFFFPGFLFFPVSLWGAFLRHGCVGCSALVLVSSGCSREHFSLRLDVPHGAGLELALASGLKLRCVGSGAWCA
jgi:hypothetical protein